MIGIMNMHNERNKWLKAIGKFAVFLGMTSIIIVQHNEIKELSKAKDICEVYETETECDETKEQVPNDVVYE